MTDPAQIARSLTKAQKVAVIKGEGTSVTVRAVFRHTPALFRRADWSPGWGYLQFPTDLCNAVRTILLQERSDA